jgi:hypothetical protein
MKFIILYFAIDIVPALMVALILGWNPITGIPHVGF